MSLNNLRSLCLSSLFWKIIGISRALPFVLTSVSDTRKGRVGLHTRHVMAYFYESARGRISQEHQHPAQD